MERIDKLVPSGAVAIGIAQVLEWLPKLGGFVLILMGMALSVWKILAAEADRRDHEAASRKHKAEEMKARLEAEKLRLEIRSMRATSDRKGRPLA